MRVIRWALLIGVLLVHLAMKAPVWFLIARIGDLVGGGGYHRAAIIDRFVADVGSWWLIGMDPSKTASWLAYQLPDGTADLTNQFVVAGVNGGVLGLTLFVALISQGFGQLGLAMIRVRSERPNDEKLLWAFGAALVATVVSFFSVSYFDQIGVVFYILLACIARVTDSTLHPDSIATPASARSPIREKVRRRIPFRRVALGGTARECRYRSQATSPWRKRPFLRTTNVTAMRHRDDVNDIGHGG
jgi:hypothetical protein